VNDVDVLTPVPRPIADTLGYRSSIDGDIGFEKCSTAPLPCTPYLPSPDVHLRVRSLGLRGGFVRQPSTGLAFSATAIHCLGEVTAAGHQRGVAACVAVRHGRRLAVRATRRPVIGSVTALREGVA
jgi:hypothetical protein